MLFAFALVIHVPPIRGWLAAHGHHGGGVCPFGYGGKPAVARTSPDARTRPALAFALGQTTSDDITRWSRDHGITCHAKHGGTFIECVDVPASALGSDPSLPAKGLWLTLDGNGTLAAIQAARRAPAATTVADAFATLGNELTAKVGAPAKRDGQPDADALARGLLRQASVEFHAAGYRARVRETNMGDGFLLTEDYARVD
jgi:hypothetical protein